MLICFFLKTTVEKLIVIYLSFIFEVFLVLKFDEKHS